VSFLRPDISYIMFGIMILMWKKIKEDITSKK
jgi:hypothetical protein